VNLTEHLQRNEYLRYAHDLRRRAGRAEVITGTAGLFKVAVLQEVVAFRGPSVETGKFVYDHTAWTEDNELTTAIKSLGYRCASPAACTVRTELMPTVRTLYFQRLRWQRGALDTLRNYGLTETTAPYFVRQVMIHIGILFFPFFVTVVVLALLETGEFPWSWPWFFVSSIVAIERVWTVRKGGHRAVLLAMLIVPEILYDLFLHVVYVRALVDSIMRSGGHWDHAEANRSRIASPVRRALRFAGQIAIPLVFVGFAVGAAALATLAGVQWWITGVIVGAGIFHSALRAVSLDPLRPILGSSEIPLPSKQTAALQFRPRAALRSPLL
jgi:biofilm PGA synthesis N-glycosyltransferase PgaC